MKDDRYQWQPLTGMGSQNLHTLWGKRAEPKGWTERMIAAKGYAGTWLYLMTVGSIIAIAFWLVVVFAVLRADGVI